MKKKDNQKTLSIKFNANTHACFRLFSYMLRKHLTLDVYDVFVDAPRFNVTHISVLPFTRSDNKQGVKQYPIVRFYPDNSIQHLYCMNSCYVFQCSERVKRTLTDVSVLQCVVCITDFSLEV